MEPVTHILTGACLARSGFNRRVAYATTAMAIAAEFPDIDSLWGLRGPIAALEHHRGITHTFLGVPFEAGLLLAGFYLVHQWRLRRGRSAPARGGGGAALPQVPTHWSGLYGCLLLALLSHLLLDFTNNYGVRPFFPFNPHWYAASIVFIFDPLLFCFLLAGLLLPSLLALVGQEVSGKRRLPRGVGWPRLALLAILVLWGARGYEHHQALVLASEQMLRAPAWQPGATDDPSTQPGGAAPSPTPRSPGAESVRPLLPARRSIASPDPLSIFRWYTAADFGPAYQLGVADTSNGSFAPGQTLTKPEPSPALTAGERSHLGRVFLDWSPMPWISITSDAESSATKAAVETTVLFEDVRFLGTTSLLPRGPTPPLTGYVLVGSRGEVIEEGLDGRPGR